MIVFRTLYIIPFLLILVLVSFGVVNSVDKIKMASQHKYEYSLADWFYHSGNVATPSGRRLDIDLSKLCYIKGFYAGYKTSSGWIKTLPWLVQISYDRWFL